MKSRRPFHHGYSNPKNSVKIRVRLNRCPTPELSGWVIDYTSFLKFDCDSGYNFWFDYNDQFADHGNEHVMFQWDPDESKPAEYMGNGGATAEYWYYAAALILSPV
jgi:hypothetical protein